MTHPIPAGPGTSPDPVDQEWTPDGTGTYTNGETTIVYDTDGNQHVVVNEGQR